MKKKTTEEKRYRRHVRSRARLSGTMERPRLNVFRSLTELFVQIIDDTSGKTLVSVHSKKDVDVSVDTEGRTGKTAQAFALGVALAKKAQEKGVTTIVFDRGGYAYHGRVAALADGARKGGLIF
jgi:large subunit ribosomal protein L18